MALRACDAATAARMRTRDTSPRLQIITARTALVAERRTAPTPALATFDSMACAQLVELWIAAGASESGGM